jgi:hypothetical protein
MSDAVTKKGKEMSVLDAEARQHELEALARRDAVAKKNFDFVQIEKKSLKELRRLTDQHPKAASLLYRLAEKMNKQNAIVVSQTTLMHLTGWSRPTVSGAVKVLKDEKWIQVLKIGTANAYIINNAVFWQDSRDKKVTTFRAQIIASAGEQDEPVERMQKLKLRHLPFAEILESQATGTPLLISGQEEPPDQGEFDV